MLTKELNYSEPNKAAVVEVENVNSSDRKPFIEPTISPASDVFEVTKSFLFMMLGSVDLDFLS